MKIVFTEFMTRSFHHKTTVGAMCGIVLFLLLAVYAFWIKNVVLGILMAFLLIVLTERTLHSQYVISDGKLIIDNGKLSKSKTIMIGQVKSCRPMTSVFGLVRYLLITYGAVDAMVSVQPVNETAFIAALKKEKEVCDAE
jgi:membrane protein YdbS with pleckstrin-like domain